MAKKNILGCGARHTNALDSSSCAGTQSEGQPWFKLKKALYGTISPGPSRYDAKSTVGVAPPNYKQSSSFSFNRESRFAY